MEKPKFDIDSSSVTTAIIDPELNTLIDRFFNLTYLNTIPMVNLLATAVIYIFFFIKIFEKNFFCCNCYDRYQLIFLKKIFEN